MPAGFCRDWSRHHRPLVEMDLAAGAKRKGNPMFTTGQSTLPGEKETSTGSAAKDRWEESGPFTIENQRRNPILANFLRGS